jgi:hypothetical protein
MVFVVVGLVSINAKQFVQDCLELNFIPGLDVIHGPRPWILYHDGAPAHFGGLEID